MHPGLTDCYFSLLPEFYLKAYLYPLKTKQ
jgi:hypothetical protein